MYGLNLAVVLLNFPLPIIDYVTAPGTGIQAQRGRRFPPTPGEVRQACEDALAMFEHAFEHATKPKRIEQAKAEREQEKRDRSERPSYEDLKAKYGPNFGLQTVEEVDREERKAARIRQEIVDHHNEIAREWDRRGVEAPTLGGIVVSPELAKQLSLKTNPKAEPKEKSDDAA